MTPCLHHDPVCGKAARLNTCVYIRPKPPKEIWKSQVINLCKYKSQLKTYINFINKKINWFIPLQGRDQFKNTK